ncbi:MAG TPA: membrane dipeptidase [Terriglobia bacterium]|nr:membrane dipeptidase [Terriglobia bacterium]
MIVVDSHLDLAWNALNWNRDLTLPVEEIRRAEADMPEHHRGANTVCFPEMRRGDVAICLATVLSRCTTVHDPMLDYRSQEVASAMGHGQRNYYRIMEGKGQLRMLRNPDDIKNHLEAWRQGSREAIGYILSMEGADPILSPDDAARWWEKGLRVVGLTHYGVGVYGHGTSSPGGLTAKGFELLKAFEELGMIVDVTHLTDKGFWQVLDSFPGKVLASHNNCRLIVPGDRQFSDEQLQALIARGAVIGAVLDSWMLWPGYVAAQTNNGLVKLARVIDHIDHICQLAGNAANIGIGSDLDGGFGREQSPSDVETIADLQNIPAMLRAKGYSEIDVEGVMHGNWIRFFNQAWSALSQ